MLRIFSWLRYIAFISFILLLNVISSSPLGAQSFPVDANHRFIAIGVNGYRDDTQIFSNNYFDHQQMRELGPDGLGYTNISTFMLSRAAFSHGSDLGKFKTKNII